MARVPYIDRSELPEESRDLLDRPENVFRALANSPDLLRAYMDFGMWMRTKCELDPRLRELAILQVSYWTRSEYEFSHHIKIGAEYGVARADVLAMFARNAGRPADHGAVEAAVLDAARQMATVGDVDDISWKALEANLAPARIVELVTVVNFYVCIARILTTMRVEVEPDYVHYLADYPFVTIEGAE